MTGRPRTARCGTASGWSRHKRDDEKPCDACTRAKREYDQRRVAAPAVQRRQRLFARAQMRAYGALAHRYPDEYAALYASMKAELFADEQEAAS